MSKRACAVTLLVLWASCLGVLAADANNNDQDTVILRSDASPDLSGPRTVETSWRYSSVSSIRTVTPVRAWDSTTGTV